MATNGELVTLERVGQVYASGERPFFAI